MTVEKKSSQIKYLTLQDIRDLYAVFYKMFQTIGEPIEPYQTINEHELENLANIPQQQYYDSEQYPTLHEKAAIIFYKVNKGHIFPNGNKRLSVAYMLLFLAINDKRLNVHADEMTRKALDIAQSRSEDFNRVKDELAIWIRERLI